MNSNIQQKITELKESLFVSAPVIVKEVYPKDQRADVQLKDKSKGDKEPPMILEVPISHKESKSFSERQLPEVDDVAWVVFTNRALDETLTKQEISTPKHDRVLDINDCFLAGEWSKDEGGISESVGKMEPDDWLLGFHRSSQSRFYMKQSSGNIILEPPPNGEIELTEDARFHVAFFEKIAEVFNNHYHIDSKGGETGPPSKEFTEEDRSNRVMVDN